MSKFKKPFVHAIFSILVCSMLISSIIILGENSNIVRAATTYQVTFATSGSGSTSPSGVLTYNSSQQVSISATPSSGFSFSSWSVSPSGAATFGNLASASTTATINGSCTITATFVQATYQVSFVVSGLGSIIPSGNQSYPSGQVVVLAATPNNGFVFGSWSASPSNATIFQDTFSPSSWVIIYGNCNITATFNLAQYQVTFAVSGNGLTSPSGTQSYLPGQQVPISATAGSGYSLASWGVSPSGAATFGNAVSASTTATINGNCTLTASFTQDAATPTPTTTSTPTPTLTLTPTPTPTSNISSTLTPTPTPSTKATPSPTTSHLTPTPLSTATSTSNKSKTDLLSVLPFSLIDLSLFFAVLSIILVPTSKLVPRYYQMIPSVIRKLEVAALVVSSLFLLTAAWQVITAIIG